MSEADLGRKRPYDILPTWESYQEWRESLTDEQIERGAQFDQWPEGTPLGLVEVHKKIRPGDKLVAALTGQLPPILEILAREIPVSLTTEETTQASATLRERIDGMLNLKLSRLTEREQIVLARRSSFLDDGHLKTSAEVAVEIGRSVRTVQRLYRSARRKMMIVDMPLTYE